MQAPFDGERFNGLHQKRAYTKFVPIGSYEDCSRLLSIEASRADNVVVVDSHIRDAVLHLCNDTVDGPIVGLLSYEGRSVVPYVNLVERAKD